MGSNPAIEKVHTETGEIKVVYTTSKQNQSGPGCGTPTYHPRDNKIIFIQGITPYDLHRRTCVMVDEEHPGKATHLDARDVIPPFTAGALRGGTHAHQFNGDGRWIGFTYNDALFADMEKATGDPVNLRTVGVMHNQRAVNIAHNSPPENYSGDWFAVLVAKAVPHPTPGSNEIQRAFSNAWVGQYGYQQTDGTWQKAQAYIGKIRTKENAALCEIFLSDIPDEIDIPGPSGPLEGNETQFPMPLSMLHKNV